MSEVTDEESGGLFDELLEEDDQLDEDTPLVDWTSHSFSMDDMTVEVSPYDKDGMVEVDQSISMEHQFDAPQQTARVKDEPSTEGEDDYVLTAADAPKNEKRTWLSYRITGGTFRWVCLLYTSPSPRDGLLSRMPSSA